MNGTDSLHEEIENCEKNNVNGLHVGEFTFIRYINIDIFLLPQYLKRANHNPS